MGNVRILYGAILMAVLLTSVSIASVSGDETIGTDVMGSFAKLPLVFIANEGQLSDGIAFQTSSADQAISLLSDRIEYIHADGSAPVSVIFMGAQPNPVISGLDPFSGTASFFHGSEPSDWTTGVELVTKVKYEELYPGIDMELSGSGGILKTEFIVHPGADPSQIALQYEGQTDIYISDDGALVASTGTRDIIDDTPYSFQIVEESEIFVESAYVLSEDAVVTFELGSYDPSLTLIIDPVMRYSLYFGGPNKDLGNAIAVDDWGYAYMLGTAMSRSLKWKPEFSVLSAQGNNAIDNSRDAFIVKINPDGTELEYLIYLGGSSEEEGSGLYLDVDGSVYLCGTTASTDFPVVNAFRSSNAGGRDAYVTKINPAGTELIFSTYLGGSAHDEALDLTLDQDRNILITGSTRSWDFPIVNRYEKSPFGGMVDAFITKMNPTASAIIYSNFIGGTAYDIGRAIAVTEGGYACVVGHTESRDFPLVNPFQSERRGHWNAFVVAFDPEGTYPAAYSTYLGGSGDEYAEGILSWPNGDITVVGKTNSRDYPIHNAIQPYRAGLWDGFITTFSPGGHSLVQSTYFGGTGNEAINGIARDGDGNVYVVGTTNSRDFPVVNAYQSRLGGASDAFVTKFDRAISTVVYSTFLGGSGNDEGRAIAVTTEGDAYVTGYTESKNFPQVWPFQQNFGDGNNDAFVSVISDNAYIPLPEFVGVPTNGEAPLTVQFTDLSRGIPTAWLWNFGDGATSTERDPLYVYTTPGTYTVSLQVSNIVSKQTLTKENYIIVREPVQPPIADFKGVPQSGVVPLVVSFTDLSLNQPTSWSWDFGDGATSTEQNPTYTYTTPGTYTVALTVTNSAGIDTAIKEQFVTAEPDVIAPIADFNANPRSGVVPLTVKFADLSRNDPTSWSWDFGDGGTSTQQHPTYKYTAPGTYTVMLTVQNKAGIDTAIKEQFVTAESGVLAPIADFNADPRIGKVPLGVTFIDLSRNDPTSWSWNFGDGGTSTEQNPFYTYLQPGRYTVSLTVTNEAGIDTATKEQFVITEPGVLAPVADFNANPRSGAAPLTVKFADLSRNGPTSWSWDFGDGGTSTQQHPTYTYTAPGTYTVMLTVQNEAGIDTAMKQQFVMVEPGVIAPIADFNANPRIGKVPLGVTFTDLSRNGPTSWSWDFGDGSTSTQQHPTYTYTAPGTYTVMLTVQNKAGIDTAMKQQFVTVEPGVLAPIADFNANPRSGIAPLTVKFADLSRNAPTSWSWDFGDGGTSSQQHPTYTYTAPGTYSVMLTVQNQAGIDTAMKQQFVTVNKAGHAPTAQFRAAPTTGTAPLHVAFTDLSTGDPISWSWTFGDGATSVERHPEHVYTAPGTYTITLTARNEFGESVAQRENYITVRPDLPDLKASFIGEPTTGMAPLTVRFTDLSVGQPKAWQWNFGDGATSTEQNPVHTYREPGSYTVYLTVTRDDARDVTAKFNYIIVNKKPEIQVDFSAYPTSGDVPLCVQFTDLSTGDITTWEWSFGDGVTSRDRNPSHTYLEAGEYTVCLTASNAHESKQQCKPNFVHVTGSKLPAEFYGTVTIGDELAPVGTLILARGPGVVTDVEGNPVTLTTPGCFGTIFPLTVYGSIQNGDPVTFWVKTPDMIDYVEAEVWDVYGGNQWQKSYPFYGGTRTRIDLRVGGNPIPPRPPLPHEFYGEVTYNGQPLPQGSMVLVKGQNVLEGRPGNPLPVTSTGFYGMSGESKLIAQGDLETGDELTFWIVLPGTAVPISAQCRNVDANSGWYDSYRYMEGGLTRLDLKAGSDIPPVPTIPMKVSGRVIVDEKPAVAGSLVSAIGKGVQTGISGNPVTVVGSAQYGTPERLRVQGNIAEGTPISFTVFDSTSGLVYDAMCRVSLCPLEVDAQCAENYGEWMASYPFRAGDDVVLDLKAYSFIPMAAEDSESESS